MNELRVAAKDREQLRIAIALCLLSLLVAAACGGTVEQTAPRSADAAASGTVAASPRPILEQTLDGGQIDLAQLVGDDVVLWFWAPW